MHAYSTRNIMLTLILPLLVLSLLAPGTVQAKEDNLTRFTLPNGLDVIVKQDPARKVAAIQFWVKVGSTDENQSQRGISHLIEHMAFKGTKKRGPGKIAKDVEALGGSTNAYTSWDRTVFLVTVPSDKVLDGLDILTDAVINPTIDPQELEREKKVVLEEILEGEERPEKKSFQLLFKTAYTKSRYRYPVIGYQDIVSKFTRDDILAFRKKWYVPQNMFLVIVGDVDPQALQPAVERMTRDLKPSKFVHDIRPVEPAQEQIRQAIVRDPNSRETFLNIAFHIPSVKGADVNALDIAADILGARDSSRLVRVLMKQKHLVHSICAYDVTPRDPGLFVVSATLDAKNVEAVARGIMDELQKLAKQHPTTEEVQRAKTHIESSYLYDRQTVGGIARTLGAYEADRGDPEFSDIYLKLNDAVTEEQVSAAVGRYLVPPNATVTALLPEKGCPDLKGEKLAQIIGSYTDHKRLVAKKASNGKAVTRTLHNGIKVVLVPDDSNPVVSFRIACLGGKRFETKETEGIMNFVAQMLDKGTKSRSEMEIARKVEAMGGRLDTFSGNDSVGLDATFLSRNVDDGLGLLADIYADASFPQDKLERERMLIINKIRTAPDRPIQFTLDRLDQTLYASHPYGFSREGAVESVQRFTREDLIRAYRSCFVPSNTVITAVGSMDVKRVMHTIADLFGEVPAREVRTPEIPKEKPLTSVKEATVRIPRAKAHVAIGFNGTTLDHPDRYALDVLNGVLAGMGGRLFRDLRDKESLAYTVTSFSRPSKDAGVFAFYIGTEPSKADRAIKGIFREINRIRSARVSPEELSRAVNNVIGEHRIALQSPWARAESVALNDLYGLGYDYDPQYVKKISQVTADQVLDVARRYLDPKRAVIVRILPDEKKSEHP
jgi:zinc protease